MLSRSEARDVVKLFQILARVEAEMAHSNVGGIKQQIREATRDNCVESIIDILCGEQAPDVDAS